jgi:membrane associated rhomboid family serine protease
VPLPLFVVGWLAMAADVLSLWRAAASTGTSLARAAVPAVSVDHPAHLGGYLSACLFYFLLDRRQRQRARTGLAINLVSAALAFTLWNCLLRR